MNLEDLRPGASDRGILRDAAVAVVSVQWHGPDAPTLVCREALSYNSLVQSFPARLAREPQRRPAEQKELEGA